MWCMMLPWKLSIWYDILTRPPATERHARYIISSEQTSTLREAYCSELFEERVAWFQNKNVKAYVTCWLVFGQWKRGHPKALVSANKNSREGAIHGSEFSHKMWHKVTEKMDGENTLGFSILYLCCIAAELIGSLPEQNFNPHWLKFCIGTNISDPRKLCWKRHVFEEKLTVVKEHLLCIPATPHHKVPFLCSWFLLCTWQHQYDRQQKFAELPDSEIMVWIQGAAKHTERKTDYSQQEFCLIVGFIYQLVQFET